MLDAHVARVDDENVPWVLLEVLQQSLKEDSLASAARVAATHQRLYTTASPHAHSPVRMKEGDDFALLCCRDARALVQPASIGPVGPARTLDQRSGKLTRKDAR